MVTSGLPMVQTRYMYMVLLMVIKTAMWLIHLILRLVTKSPSLVCICGTLMLLVNHTLS